MKTAIVAAIVLGTSLNVMADFAEDFQEAKKLLDGKKYGAAAEAFAELAASAPNDHGKAWSLAYAAMALGRQKQYDQAIELARTIEAEPMAAYAQMAIMDTNRKHKDLIAVFREEDIGVWPDQINYKGFFLRGVAYAVIGDLQAAVKDFEQCADLAGSDTWIKLEALNRVGALYHALEDDAKAMDTYKKAFAIYDGDPRRKGRWLYPQALLAAARILMSQSKYDEALAVLAKFGDTSHKSKRNVWAFLVLEAHGDVYAAQGKKGNALAKYQDAVTIDTHQSYIDRVNRKIGALKGRKESR